MKYVGMPLGMWFLFGNSFRNQLSCVVGIDSCEARKIKANAKIKYKEIIAKIPEFEKKDIFKMNIVNCALFSAFILSMKERPGVEKMTEFYSKAMMTPVMKAFCRKAGKNKFSEKDIQRMKDSAAFKAADRNPYSWNKEFFLYEDGSGYEARFSKCGICVLMKELGLAEYIPAMCKFDYTMSDAGGTSVFVRKYTLASGGPYCDCGYKKKNQ